MKPYEPSGKFEAIGLAFSALIGAGAAILLAFGAYHLSRAIYIVIFSAVLHGLGVGVLLILGIRVGKIRSSLVAIALGLVSGFLSSAAYHGLENERVRSLWIEHLTNKVTDEGRQITEEEARNIARRFSQMDLLRMRAEFGIEIGRGGKNLLKLTGATAFIYWGIEALIVAGTAIFFPWYIAKKPFCEKCREWFIEAEFKRYAISHAQEVTGALTEGKFDVLQGLPPPTGKEYAMILLRKCPRCIASGVVAALVVAALNSKKQLEKKEVLCGVLTPDEIAHLLEVASDKPDASSAMKS